MTAVVYYYNPSYWKNGSQYDRILSKYHVNSVPLLVKMVDEEYRDAYQFDPDATKENFHETILAYYYSIVDFLFTDDHFICG